MTTEAEPQQGETWMRVTDRVMLLVHVVRIAGPVKDGRVPVQTEKASGGYGKVRLERISHFGDGPNQFAKAKR